MCPLHALSYHLTGGIRMITKRAASYQAFSALYPFLVSVAPPKKDNESVHNNQVQYITFGH